MYSYACVDSLSYIYILRCRTSSHIYVFPLFLLKENIIKNKHIYTFLEISFLNSSQLLLAALGYRNLRQWYPATPIYTHPTILDYVINIQRYNYYCDTCFLRYPDQPIYIFSMPTSLETNLTFHVLTLVFSRSYIIVVSFSFPSSPPT